MSVESGVAARCCQLCSIVCRQSGFTHVLRTDSGSSELFSMNAHVPTRALMIMVLTVKHQWYKLQSMK